MVLSIEHAGDIRLFPTGVDGFVRGHLDLRDGLGQFLVGIPASEGIPLPGGHLVQLDHGVAPVPLAVVLGAAVGVVGQGVIRGPAGAAAAGVFFIDQGKGREGLRLKFDILLISNGYWFQLFIQLWRIRL